MVRTNKKLSRFEAWDSSAGVSSKVEIVSLASGLDLKYTGSNTEGFDFFFFFFFFWGFFLKF